MSYDVCLTDPVTGDELLTLHPHLMHGGTYCVGGTCRLRLNITYNYTPHMQRAFANDEGVSALYGKSAAETLPMLDEAIGRLADDATTNYWDATDGNAKRALMQLRAMAHLQPDGIWRGQW